MGLAKAMNRTRSIIEWKSHRRPPPKHSHLLAQLAMGCPPLDLEANRGGASDDDPSSPQREASPLAAQLKRTSPSEIGSLEPERSMRGRIAILRERASISATSPPLAAFP